MMLNSACSCFVIIQVEQGCQMQFDAWRHCDSKTGAPARWSANRPGDEEYRESGEAEDRYKQRL